jgi:hypothetical protein
VAKKIAFLDQQQPLSGNPAGVMKQASIIPGMKTEAVSPQSLKRRYSPISSFMISF